MISQKALSEFIDVSFSYRNLDIISKAVIAIGIISFIVGIIVAIIGINNVGSSYEDFLGIMILLYSPVGLFSIFSRPTASE